MFINYHHKNSGIEDHHHHLNEDLNVDLLRDQENRDFLDELKQVGPFSKQILNYTYPPLLYQRGDEDDDEDEDDEDEDDNDNHHQQNKMLPDLMDDSDNDDD